MQVKLFDKVLEMAGVHAALLKNGRVLFFAAMPPKSFNDLSLENNVDLGIAQVWDEQEGVVDTIVMKRNLFCSGHCFLPNNGLLIAAGQSNNNPVTAPLGVWGADHDIHVFSLGDDFERYTDMPEARYYPTCVTLANGNGLICSGAVSRIFNPINKKVEIFNWQDKKLTPARIFDDGDRVKTMYPFVHLMPSGNREGNLFVFSQDTAHIYDLKNQKWSNPFPAMLRKNRNYHHQGSSIILPYALKADIIRVLVVGGEGDTHDEATDTSEIFHYHVNHPNRSGWGDVIRMNNKRFMGDTVYLLDGNILLVNGASRGAADHSGEAVLEVELFDPKTNDWISVANINNERMYHATATLLPSGNVVIAGNTQNWNPDHPTEDRSLEIIYPEYTTLQRPVILTQLDKVRYDQPLELKYQHTKPISHVAVIRCGSVTHTNNFDQRYIVLETDVKPDSLKVKIPDNPAYMPPGNYMLTIVDVNNVPSVAEIITLVPETYGYQLVKDKKIRVRPTQNAIDTDIEIRDKDEIELSGSGSFWNGNLFAGSNGPEGVSDIANGDSFPYHGKSDAHKYSLIGKFGGNGSFFYIGKRLNRHRYAGSTRTIRLMINDDVRDDGNGAFYCRIKIWRRV